MGFSAELETNYLRRLPQEVRGVVLVEELTTLAEEQNLFSFRKKYKRVGEKIVDEKSREPVGDVVRRGNNAAEVKAWGVIEESLANESTIVVNFSPENGVYPKNVVDIWQADGNVVTWSRYTVEDDYDDFARVYEQLAGKKVETRTDMLANPITIENGRPKDVLKYLDVVKEKVSITKDQIEQVAKILVKDFTKRFGKDFALHNDKMFRVYSAVMDKVREMVTNGWDKIKISAEVLRDYAYLPMVNVVQQTYGCDKQTVVGGFVSRLTNWFSGAMERVKSFFSEKSFPCPRCKGEIESGKGIEKCPHCGMTKQEAGSTCD